MKKFTDSSRIILSRALTNSGDQAWDFAVPVSLAVQLPGQLDVVALVFFLARLSHVLLLPLAGNLMDRISRFQALKIGLFSQFVGVSTQIIALILLHRDQTFALAAVILGGVLSGLGASVTNIGVAQDVVPTLFSGTDLTRINSRIRQVDLFSEVLSPVLAGLLLTLSLTRVPLLGLLVVAAWNLISFAPEYLLVRKVLIANKIRFQKPNLGISQISIWNRISLGWKELTKSSIAPAVFAYALLWLSVLSPHGVLLTSFLKESWRLPEFTLGLFRGLGAIFGLLATLVFPILVNRAGLLAACRISILFQTSTLMLALLAFHSRHDLAFLLLILFSRIGLYGFSLGEQQIRQLGIPETNRGAVNSAAAALTGVATLCLLGLGTIDQFQRLVDISVGCVFLASLIFLWGMKRGMLNKNNQKESS